MKTTLTRLLACTVLLMLCAWLTPSHAQSVKGTAKQNFPQNVVRESTVSEAPSNDATNQPVTGSASQTNTQAATATGASKNKNAAPAKKQTPQMQVASQLSPELSSQVDEYMAGRLSITEESLTTFTANVQAMRKSGSTDLKKLGADAYTMCLDASEEGHYKAALALIIQEAAASQKSLTK